MSIHLSILFIIIGCALVTVIPRVIPFIVISRIELPDKLVRWLTYIPICIFTALIVDRVIVDDPSSILVIDWIVVIAILPTLLTAILTKSLSITVIVGIVSMAIIRLIQQAAWL